MEKFAKMFLISLVVIFVLAICIYPAFSDGVFEKYMKACQESGKRYDQCYDQWWGRK